MHAKMMASVVLSFTTWLAAEPSSSRIPTEGLVAYYPFNGSPDDASGHGNHATAFGAILTNDKFGQSRSAYEFNGQTDYLTATVTISPSIMPKVTMTAWAKAKQTDHIAIVLSNASGNQNNRTLLMRPSPGKGVCWATSTNAGGSWVWHKVEPDKWTFLAISYDQPAKKVFLHVDDCKYEADCSQIDGAIDLSIGRNVHSGQYFHGDLDEVRVYDRVLKDNEIAALHQQFLNGEWLETNPASAATGERRGLLVAFITGFVIFTGIIIALNVMIRRDSMPA